MGRAERATREIAIGYAAGPTGLGVVYASLSDEPARDVLRLPFRLARISPLAERAAGYAALATVARAVHKRGVTRARFVLSDQEFVEEMTGHCELPERLVLPYVRLRCALNAFEAFEITSGATDELSQRARAEAALNLAA